MSEESPSAVALEKCRKTLRSERVKHKKTLALLKELMVVHTADAEVLYPGHPGEELYPRIERHIASLAGAS